MANIGTIYGRIGMDVSSLDRAERRMREFTGKMTGAFGRLRQSIFSIQSAFVAMGATIGAGIAIHTIKNFESAVVDMGKVTDQNFEDMKKQIFSLDAALGDSEQLFRGYYQTISAGVTDPKKALELLETASKLAKAAHIDQATSVKSLAVIMGAYGDQLEGVTEAADLMIQVEAKGITTTGELAQVIGRVANLAKEMGLSADEMGAALAQVTKSGVGTNESITQLRGLLTSLNRAFERLPESVQKYGSTLEAVKALGFEGVLREITKATNGNTTEMTKMLGEIEALNALLQIARNNFSEYGEIMDSMPGKVGNLEKAWERFEVSLEGILEMIRNLGKNIIIQLTDQALPVLKEQLQKVADSVQDWIDRQQRLKEQNMPNWFDKTAEAAGNLGRKLDELLDTLKAIREWGESLPKGAGTAAAGGYIGYKLFGPKVGAFIAAVALLNPHFEKLLKNFEALDRIKGLDDEGGKLSFLFKSLISPGGPLYEVFKAIMDAPEMKVRVTIDEEKLSGLISDFEATNRLTVDISDNLDSSADNMERLAGFAKSFVEDVRSTEGLVDLELYFENNREALDKYARQREQFAEAERQFWENQARQLVNDIALRKQWAAEAQASLGTNVQLMQGMPNMAERLEEALKDPDAYFGKMKNAMIDWGVFMEEITREVARSMQRNFSDLFFDAMTGELDSLEDYADAIFRSINRIAADALAQVAIDWAKTSLFSGGGGGGGNIFSSIFGWITSLFKWQHGGLLTEPVLGVGLNTGHGHLIGEAGPEWIVPASKTVDESTKAGGWGQVVINNYVQATDGRISRESLSQLGATTARALQRASRRNN